MRWFRFWCLVTSSSARTAVTVVAVPPCIVGIRSDQPSLLSLVCVDSLRLLRPWLESSTGHVVQTFVIFTAAGLRRPTNSVGVIRARVRARAHFAALGVCSTTGDALLNFPPFHEPLEPYVSHSWPLENISGQAKRTVRSAWPCRSWLGILALFWAYSSTVLPSPHIVAIGRQCHVLFNGKRESSPLPDRHRGENEEVDREMTVSVG